MIKKDDYELYFLNDSYDDEIISDMTASFKNRLYYDILKGKHFIQNNDILNGDISDISINIDLNRRYHMPENTYSLWLNRNLVPFYSEKAFLNKYDYETPISSNTIMEDNLIFNKSFYFFIDDYMIYDVKVVIKRDGCIIFIPVTSNDTESDICKNHLEELITDLECDDTWTSYLGTKSDFYYGYASRSTLFTDNKIYVSNLSTHKSYDKPVKNNSWTVYLTFEQRSKNIMVSSTTTLESDEKGYYFLIDENFKNLVYSHTNVMKCLVVNEPESSGNGVYINVDSTEPIFQIPYKENPIPLENIIVWKYDYNTKRKLHPMQIYAEMKYPNIYDFTDMMKESYFQTLYSNSKLIVSTSNRESFILSSGSDKIKNFDLYIEWVEPTQDISAFDSYIQDYIDCYGDAYAEMNERKETDPLVYNYKPIESINFTSEDYFNSEWIGDYRAWRLEKMIQLLKDNPIRYDELFNKIYEKRKKVISKTYTYKSDNHIYNRSIMDNKSHCDNAEELFVEFKEPHTYICIYNASCSTRSCSLFINGKLKDTTYIMNYGSTLYIYFPVSYIVYKENIHIDVYLDDFDIETKKIRLNQFKTEYDFDESPFQRENSLTNLVLYNTETNDYIDLSEFSLELQICMSDIQYIGLNKWDSVSFLSTDIELYENNYMLVVPVDADMIILQQEDIRHIIENLASNKKIDLNNIVIRATNNKYNDTQIGIASTNFKKTWKKTVRDAYTQKQKKLKIPNFKGKPDPNRFHIYANGVLIDPNEYIVTFTTYDGEVTFTFDSNLRYGVNVIEYTGYDIDILYNGKYGDLNKTNDDILYLDDIIDTPFDKKIYQVYINGYRVPEIYINVIGQSSMIKINNPDQPSSDNSHVIIFKQRTDKDPFEYETELQFINSVAKNDSIFRSYLLSKYDI